MFVTLWIAGYRLPGVAADGGGVAPFVAIPAVALVFKAFTGDVRLH